MESLHEIGLKYKTDKSYYHNYCTYYDTILSNQRLTAKNILEVGIDNGCSLLMWNDYFVNANIYGIDISLHYNPILREKNRIHCIQDDQSNLQTKFNVEFDMIIDDGSHIVSHQKATIEKLWPTLKKGGIYILEDLHTNIRENFFTHPHLNPSVIDKYIDLPVTCHDGILQTMQNKPYFSFHSEIQSLSYFSNIETKSLTCIFYKKDK
jgi:hypothetical protein